MQFGPNLLIAIFPNSTSQSKTTVRNVPILFLFSLWLVSCSLWTRSEILPHEDPSSPPAPAGNLISSMTLPCSQTHRFPKSFFLIFQRVHSHVSWPFQCLLPPVPRLTLQSSHMEPACPQSPQDGPPLCLRLCCSFYFCQNQICPLLSNSHVPASTDFLISQQEGIFPFSGLLSYLINLLLHQSTRGLSGKEPACSAETQEMWVWSLWWEDPLEEEMAIHSSILAWEIPWTGSQVGYSPWGHKESDTT